MKFHPAALSGAVCAPASKSESHRLMICAGLTAGTTQLEGYMASADMDATRRCLTALGADITQQGDVLTVCGHARKAKALPVMDCGESGSTLRFFVPIALAMTGGATFRMHGRLGQRPMEVYRDLFVPRGVNWYMGIGADGAAELTVRGHMEAGQYVLPGNVSSQFVSGLMFALPLLEGESTLTVLPPVESAGYILMTLDALRRSGIALEETGPFSWRIKGNQRYSAHSGRLSGDYSQAAVLLCASALGANVTVSGLAPDTTQGDRAVLKHLTALGAEVTEGPDGVQVRGGNLRGTTLDLHDCPDVAPMLALVCQLSAGESRLNGCGRLRLKECDRLAATVAMLNAMGGNAAIDGDAMVIRGVNHLKGGAEVDVCNDHRMVMLAAVAATRCLEPLTFSGAQALNKSWPEFLDVYRSLGGIVE